MSHPIDLKRRKLMAAGMLAVAGWRGARALPKSGVLPPDDRHASSADAAPVLLSELAYGQVQFDAGPLARQALENHRLVLALDEDALLRPFRLRAGQRAPGQELGGWYDTYAFAPGATFGQWVSALSRFYAINGDEAARAKVQRLVRGYAATLDSPRSFYRNNRFPAYTYDKITGGLLDAHRWAREESALPTLARATHAALPYLPAHAMPRNEHALPGQDFSEHAWDESYTVPENQFLAWRVTGAHRHLELARRFLYDEFFEALARGENVLPGKHAYSHVNGLSSSAQAYVSLGTPKYLAAARNGFDMIAAQSYATGGWGPDEHFVVPDSGALGASLQEMRKSFETPCGAYAHFKLTRYLLRISGDSRYGDSMERVLYNTVLGAMPIQPDGHAFYYSDYTRRAKKSFHPDRWPCCSGSLPMVVADYAISTCFADRQGLYVNLYVPAQVSWTQGEQRCGLGIETDYPYSPTVNLKLKLANTQTFTLNLRIPAWTVGAAVRINGQPEAQPLEPGRFAALRREWHSGDTIELQLPLMRRLESIDAAHPHTVALLAGPLVLMRILGEHDGEPPALSRASLLAAERDPRGSHEWQASTTGGRVSLKPFIDIDGESYSVYQDVLPA